VPGGTLVYEVRDGSTEPVLAVHGVSSQRRLWNWFSAVAPEVTLVMPDLRGRADSVDVAGPYTPARHAEDLVAVLDDAGLDRVHVLGMSMGGFVAVELAASHPDRVKTLILVDGGYRMAAPPGMTRQTLPLVMADRVGRLGRRWSGVDEYLEYFTGSTAPLLDRADPLLRNYLEHDLADGRVRLSGEALIDDAVALFFDELAWDRVEVPIRYVTAEWSAGADTPPAYPPESVERIRDKALRVVEVKGVDHASLIMTRRGAQVSADLVREALR